MWLNIKNTMKLIYIIWFRRNLRLPDNTSLLKTVELRKAGSLCMVLSELWNKINIIQRNFCFIHHSFNELGRLKMTDTLNFFNYTRYNHEY